MTADYSAAKWVARLVARSAAWLAQQSVDHSEWLSAAQWVQPSVVLMDMMMADCSAEQLASMTVGQWAHS